MKSPHPHTVEVIGALRSLIRRARAEKGFVSSQIALDVDDPTAIQYEERWKSGADLENQIRSSRYTQLLALMESSSEPPLLEFHFVSETRSLEYIAAVRDKKRTGNNAADRHQHN
jgi:quinol monooxygenase YgiN